MLGAPAGGAGLRFTGALWGTVDSHDDGNSRCLITQAESTRSAATPRAGTHPTQARPEPLASTKTMIFVDDLLNWVDNMAMTWELPWRLGNDAPGPMA